MSVHVRTTVISGFIFLALLSACGGSPPDAGPCADCTTQEAKQSCGPLSGCDPEEPPPPPTLYAKFYMQMWNATGGVRRCMYTYSYTAASGAPVSGAVVAADLLAAGERRTTSITVPVGTVVGTTSGCWHPDSGDVERAVYSTNRTVNGTQTCLSAYSFTSTGPVVEYPCWYGTP